MQAKSSDTNTERRVIRAALEVHAGHWATAVQQARTPDQRAHAEARHAEILRVLDGRDGSR
jgi:hypothetical protein